MGWVWLPRWKALLVGGVVAAAGAAVIGGIFVFSGVYNVAASRHHFDITNAVIRLTLRRSIATHSIGTDVPADLDDERLARLGARHFQLGCAPCHGSPAAAQNPVAEEMYPAPPPLSRAAEHWDTEELFWIVKHGLKFTGMPSWPAPERDEEVWAMVAFLERLPGMGAETYAEMAGSEADPAGAAPLDLGVGDTGAEREPAGVVAMCDACHGAPGEQPVHPLVPTLAGQKQDYLHRALGEYARERRPSGIMEPIAADLGAERIAALAQHYSARGEASSGAVDADAARRGAAIARGGVREDDIPACLACHTDESSGQFPLLDGLPAEYVATQLRLFRQGVRDGSTYAAIMAPIAQRLDDGQIEDVAAYFAGQAPGNGAAGGWEPEAGP